MNHVTDERTDRPLGRDLRDWLERSVEELPDGPELPPAIRSDVLSQLPGTPQRRRWWPFRWSPFGRGATRSADREKPHVEGRPKPMFNATRIAVAASIIALVGGLSYVAAPTFERAVVPAAPAPVSGEDFAGFTGTFYGVGPTVSGQRTDYDWGSTTEGDLYRAMTIKVDDERLSGKASAIHNALRFKLGAVHGVRTLSARVENDGGSWEGMGIAFHDPSDQRLRYELLLSGREGHEGLSAMLTLVSDTGLSSHEATGVIFPGELPELPTFEGTDPGIEPVTRSEIDPADYGGYRGNLSTAGMVPGETTDGQYGSETRGEHWPSMTLETDDPRMSGTQESFLNANTFTHADEAGLISGRVHTTTDRIVTDDGWWDQTAWGYQHPDTGAMHYVNQLTGHGAHEGLSAIDFVSQAGYRLDRIGVIFPGALPPVPELPPVE